MIETVEILMILGTAYQEISGQEGYAVMVFRDNELSFIKPDGSIHKLGPTTWSEMTGKPPLPILDSEGKLAPHYLPSLHVSNTFRVDSEEDLLTLDADSGDLAVNSAAQRAWILVGDAAVAEDWVELQYFPVASVAGKTGHVALVVSDIEGLPEEIASILASIASINDELTNIGEQLAEKADATALSEVVDQLGDKVDTTEFTALQGVVDEKIGADDYNLLVAAINAKAEQSALNDALALIAQKASQSSLETLSTSVAGKAEQAALTALSAVVAGKSNVGHGHAISDVSGLQDELDGKEIKEGFVEAPSQAINWDNGRKQFITASNNLALTFTGGEDGDNFLLEITAGGADRTVTFPAGVFPAYTAPSFVVPSGKLVVVTGYKRGANYVFFPSPDAGVI